MDTNKLLRWLGQLEASLQHTPRPWTVAYSTNPYESNIIYAKRPTGFDGIAITITEVDGEVAPEDEANARLIAAAPELLSALRDVAEQIVAYDYLHGANACAIDAEPALAAIGEATKIT